MNIFICDDEPKILSEISSKTKAFLAKADIFEFSDGKILLEAMTDHNCDILLLDIDMPEISGLDIAAQYNFLEKRPLLVFITSHDELVYDSLKFHPFGFVRKSYMDKELPQMLSDCADELSSRERHFCFHTSEGDVKLKIEEILYFEAQGNYLKLCLKDGEYRFRGTLSAVKNTLSDSGFIRIHKGFLVNQAAVKMLAADEAALINNVRLPIGRSYAETAKKLLMRYMLK